MLAIAEFLVVFIVNLYNFRTLLIHVFTIYAIIHTQVRAMRPTAVVQRPQGVLDYASYVQRGCPAMYRSSISILADVCSAFRER